MRGKRRVLPRLCVIAAFVLRAHWRWRLSALLLSVGQGTYGGRRIRTGYHHKAQHSIAEIYRSALPTHLSTPAPLLLLLLLFLPRPLCLAAGPFTRIACRALATADTPDLHGGARLRHTMAAVRSAHVLVAMHGAGAANALFLRADGGGSAAGGLRAATALLEVGMGGRSFGEGAGRVFVVAAFRQCQRWVRGVGGCAWQADAYLQLTCAMCHVPPPPGRQVRPCGFGSRFEWWVDVHMAVHLPRSGDAVSAAHIPAYGVKMGQGLHACNAPCTAANPLQPPTPASQPQHPTSSPRLLPTPLQIHFHAYNLEDPAQCSPADWVLAIKVRACVLHVYV